MWHCADLASVLVALWCLDDDERREQLVAEDAQLRSAQLINFAMWDGKRLNAEVERHLATLREPVGTGPSNADIIDAAHAYLARASGT